MLVTQIMECTNFNLEGEDFEEDVSKVWEDALEMMSYGIIIEK